MRQVGRLLAEGRRQIVTQVAIGEAGWERLKQQHRTPQRLDLRIGEAKRTGPMRRDLNGTVHFLGSLFGEQAVMVDLFDQEQTAVCLKTNLSKSGHVAQALADIKVAGFIDRGFGP